MWVGTTWRCNTFSQIIIQNCCDEDKLKCVQQLFRLCMSHTGGLSAGICFLDFKYPIRTAEQDIELQPQMEEYCFNCLSDLPGSEQEYVLTTGDALLAASDDPYELLCHWCTWKGNTYFEEVKPGPGWGISLKYL